MEEVAGFVLVYVLLLLLVRTLKGLAPSPVVKRRFDNGTLIGCFVLLFILAAFRDFSIHNDTITYVMHFMGVPTGMPISKIIDTKDRYEVGYQIYEAVIHNYISPNPVYLNAITAGLLLIASFAFFKKYSENIPILLICYFLSFQYIQQMGVQRQSIAVIFFFLMFTCIDKRKYIAAILCLVVSYYIHDSTILNLAIFACFLMKPTKRNISLMVAVAVIVFIVYASLLSYMEEFIEDTRYSDTSAEKGFFNMVGVFEFISTSVMAAMILLFRQRCPKGKTDDAMFMVTILYLAVSLLSIRIWVLTRYSMYYIPVILIYLTNLAQRTGRRRNELAVVGFMLVYFFFLLSERPDWYSIYPYKFII